MLVTTTERIPDQEYEVLGECFGVTTQSRDIISNFGAGLKNLVGGEIKGYTKMLTTSRQEAIDRLKEEAAAMGADAVVMMRFDSVRSLRTCSRWWPTGPPLNSSKKIRVRPLT